MPHLLNRGADGATRSRRDAVSRRDAPVDEAERTTRSLMDLRPIGPESRLPGNDDATGPQVSPSAPWPTIEAGAIVSL
jgi:hypothetical protein